MRRYFFNFFNGERWIKDNIGQEIDGLNNVILETNSSLFDMSKDFLLYRSNEKIMFSVTDEFEAVAYRCTLFVTKEIMGLVPVDSQADDTST